MKNLTALWVVFRRANTLKAKLADCYCTDGPEFLLQVLLDSGLEFDQAIVYKKKRFLHLSLKRGGGNRKMVVKK